MMEVIFENSVVKISTTGRDTDFIAVVENKTDSPIRLKFALVTDLAVPANDWVGILADSEGELAVELVRNKRFAIEETV